MAEDTRKRPDFSTDHSPSPVREPGGDPLAELARLIGQSDPFADGARRGVRKPFDSVKTDDRPAPEWLARPASSSDRDENDYEQPAAPRHDYAAPASHRAEDHAPAVSYEAATDHTQAAPVSFAQDSRYAPSERYAPEHAAHEPASSAYQADHGPEYQGAADAYQADDRYRVALPAGEYDADSYYADDGHVPPRGEDGVVSGRRRGGIVTIAAVLGLAVIGTAGAFGYRAFTSPSSTSSPPVIKADPTPAKTVPPAAASADSQGKPFQDRIAAASAPERVVPREEQPVALPVTTPRVTAPQPSAQAAAPLVTPPSPTSVNEPKRVRTLTIRQDGSDTTATAPPAAAAPSTAARPAPPAAKQQSSGPMAINPQSEPSARTKVATRSPAPAASGAYVVQVSAQRTEAEAQSSYQALQARYPTVLGGRNANFRRVDLGDKGGIFYRAQVGTFATSDQATTFCNSLKEAGGQCIVQKN